jgi:hypothetical protein
MSADPVHWISQYNQTQVLFGFLDLQGSPIASVQQLERIVRPGTNGIGVIYTGKRGEPFQLQTRVDAASAAAALVIYAAYKSTIGTKKDLYYCRAFWGSVLIGNCQIVNIQKTGRLVGGLNVGSSPAAAMLTVTWTLETLHAS